MNNLPYFYITYHHKQIYYIFVIYLYSVPYTPSSNNQKEEEKLDHRRWCSDDCV